MGATGVAVTTGVWYLIDVKVNASANPWTVDVQVDGAACGQATLAAAAGTTQQLALGNSSTATLDMYADDLLVSHTSGDYPLGGGYVISYIPNADGTHNVAGANDFERTLTGTDIINTTTDAYELVNDRPLEAVAGDFINGKAPPNTTDYVEVAYEDSAESVAPRSVEAIAGYHDASGAGTHNFQLTLRSGSTTADIMPAATRNVGATMSWGRAHFTTIPGGTAWTLDAFNALVSRIIVSDPSPDVYLDGLMLEAEYAPAETEAEVVAAIAGAGGVAAAVTIMKAITAALAGAGSITATITLMTPVTATLSGTGTLTATFPEEITAALAGAGTVTSALTIQQAIAATLSGAGTLTGAVTVQVPVTAALAGVGTLSAFFAEEITAALAGAGAMSATLTVQVPVTAVLEGAGSLTANIDVPVAGEVEITAALSGTGSLTAAVTLITDVAAGLAGAGSLTSTVTLLSDIAAVLSGTGTLVAALTLDSPITAVLAGAATVSADVSLMVAIDALLAGTGTLTAAADILDTGAPPATPAAEAQPPAGGGYPFVNPFPLAMRRGYFAWTRRIILPVEVLRARLRPVRQLQRSVAIRCPLLAEARLASVAALNADVWAPLWSADRVPSKVATRTISLIDDTGLLRDIRSETENEMLLLL